MDLQKNFPGSMPNLFMTSDIIIENIRKRLSQFANFKALYTDGFLDSLKGEAAAAEQMPDEATRALWHQGVRTELVLTAGIALERWRSLKRYIATAFPGNMEANWNSAGWGFYAEAANHSWDNVRSLCVAAMGYMSNNASALKANDNMPDGFPAQFAESFADFTSRSNLFYQKEEDAKKGTGERMDACNKMYAKLIGCCLDGQHIFERDAVVAREYSYEAVSEMVSPPGAAGIAVETVHTVDGVEVALNGVEVSIAGTDMSGTTANGGKVSFEHLVHGPVRVKLMADGYGEQLVDAALEPGTTKRMKVMMQPLFSGAMRVGSEDAGVPAVG